MRYLIIFSIFTLIISCHSIKNEKQVMHSDFKHEDKIDALVDTFLMDTVMNSISVGVYHKGEEFTKHYGELDPGKNNRPTNETIYDIGSVTKTFVGTLIAQAELEGKLSLEDDIRKYLKGNFSNLQYENEPITIRHLMTHTSGLPRFLPLAILDEFSKEDAELDLSTRVSALEVSYTKEQFFEDLQKIVIDTLPGYNHDYSNAGGELASYILEKVYERPFEELLQEKLWKKVDMNSTMIAMKESKKRHYANGYGDYKQQKPPMKTNLWGGSGFGKSSTADLINYIKYQLDEKNLEAQKSQEILFDQSIIYGDPRNKMGYMWLMSTDRDFGKVLNHHGGSHGTQIWLFIYPEEQLGVSIITNQSDRNTAGKLINVAYGILEEIAKNKGTRNK